MYVVVIKIIVIVYLVNVSVPFCYAIKVINSKKYNYVIIRNSCQLVLTITIL